MEEALIEMYLAGVSAHNEGYPEILGVCEGAKEDKAGWSAFLTHLKERGLNGVRLIISDACMGLAGSAAEFFPDAAFQRCVVHWYRNIFSHVPSTKVREIAAMLKAIHASEDIVAAREKAVRVIEKLRGLRLTRAAELVETAVEETLTYYAFPEEHWRRTRTNNPLERILRVIRRRTRVVGAFPDGQSALNLAAARCGTLSARFTQLAELKTPLTFEGLNVLMNNSRFVRDHNILSLFCLPTMWSRISELTIVLLQIRYTFDSLLTSRSRTKSRYGPLNHSLTGTRKPIFFRLIISNGKMSLIAVRSTAFPPLQPIRYLSGIRATMPARTVSIKGIRPSIEPAIIIRSPRSSRLSGSHEV